MPKANRARVIQVSVFQFLFEIFFTNLSRLISRSSSFVARISLFIEPCAPIASISAEHPPVLPLHRTKRTQP
jgi:hypothetical protein